MTRRGRPPSRASLHRLEGTLAEASRVTTTRRRTGTTTVNFQLTLQPAGAAAGTGAEPVKLTIPAIEMAESDLRGMLGKTVLAEYDGERDVYALSVGGQEVLRYDQTLERRHLGFRQYHVDGIAILGASAVVLLLAGGWTAIRLRRDAARVG